MMRRNGILVIAAVGMLNLVVVPAASAQATVAHWFRGSGTPIKVTATAPPYQQVANFQVPAGSWALHGTATVAVTDTVDAAKLVHKGSLTCVFAGGADGFTVSSPSPSGTFGYSTGMMVTVAFQAALTFSATTPVTLDCIEGDKAGDVNIRNVSLVATPVGSVLRH